MGFHPFSFLRRCPHGALALKRMVVEQEMQICMFRRGTKKRRLQKEYWEAVAEYHRINKYLKAATGVLSKPDRELLLEFAALAKSKYERLRRAMNRRSAKDARD